jgi:hypothetical protein
VGDEQGKKVICLYKGQEVTILRPAAPGDEGWDATKDGLILIRFEGPQEGDKVKRDIVVHRDDVKPK